MKGQCQFCGIETELEVFQKFQVCKECKEGGEQFLNDCSDYEMFEADEELDILSATITEMED